MSITNLSRITLELNGEEARKKAATDPQVMNYIRAVQRRVDGFNLNFEPQYMARKITPSGGNTNSALGLLSLNDDLLELFSITIGGTAYVYNTDIIPYPNSGQSPIRTLQIANCCNGPLVSWYACCPATLLNSIVITGLWGMHRYYARQGFFASGGTCPALDAVQRSFVVAGVNLSDPDIYNRAPMISPGNLIRVDNELMEVVNTSIPDNSLTVLRGWRDTPIVTHAVGTSVQVYEPEEDIANEATRQAGLMYARRGAFTANTNYPDGSTVTYPSDLLWALKHVIQQYNFE